ncbi:MAG: hypothetical protein K5909_04430 [Bacteroidales bacterium]|nr:hypothetical protein [Bacteroidales bacterium]
MKRLLLIFALLGASLAGFAQHRTYATYDLTQKTDKLSDIFYCENAMSIAFGYTNMQWKDPNGFTAPGAPANGSAVHGFKYESDFQWALWGPLALDIQWIGFNFGMGKWGNDLATHMSWNVGLMPTFSIHITPDIQFRAYAGYKAYLAFCLDGTDPFPLTTLSDNVESIGKGGWINKTIGADLVFEKFGIRLSYEAPQKGRLKDSWYANNPSVTRETYNPGYYTLNLGLVWWFEL